MRIEIFSESVWTTKKTFAFPHITLKSYQYVIKTSGSLIPGTFPSLVDASSGRRALREHAFNFGNIMPFHIFSSFLIRRTNCWCRFSILTMKSIQSYLQIFKRRSLVLIGRFFSFVKSQIHIVFLNAVQLGRGNIRSYVSCICPIWLQCLLCSTGAHIA